jgi:transposase
MTESNLLFVGIDWATETHQVCVLDHDGNVLEERQVRHTGTELADLCARLLARADGDPQRIHLAIEVPHGAVVDTLLERGFRVHSINPKQLDRFRDRFTTAGAKDDRRDALVLADSLRTDRRAFRALETDQPWVIELREQSRMHDELNAERTKLTNRMREQLRRYFPAFLDVAGDPAANFARALFELIPTPSRAHEVKPYRVRKLLQAHRVRRIDAETLLDSLREPALFVAEGTVEAAVAHVRLLAERVALVVRQQREVLRRIDELLATDAADEDAETKSKQRDAAILQSLPGTGRIVVATLLAEASRLLDAQDYQGLRTLSGVAPVTRRSGKKHVVGMRKACHPRIRNAVYHMARVASQHEPMSKARYQALRGRGASHGRALRSVADRLLRIACAMLRDRTTWRPPAADASEAA